MSGLDKSTLAGAAGLEVRLAVSEAEVKAAQALRYRVFYEEMGAKPCARTLASRLDFDEFDTICDHLLVLDHNRGQGAAAVVGTYRLIPRAKGEAFGRFYSESEYDLSKLKATEVNFLELGRSCVDLAYRTGTTMQLLWAGIANYVWDRDIKWMFGCASLPGTDPDALAVQLSYLHHNHLAPQDVRPRAVPARFVDMNRMAADQINLKRALVSLPPLVKGYLRLGGFVGEGAVIDEPFNTTDVCILVKTELVTDKYVKHYDRPNRERG